MTILMKQHLLLAICLCAFLFNSALAQKPQTRAEKMANENLLKQTAALSFEANQGQAPAKTRFLVRKHQFAIGLSATHASMSMRNAQCQCSKNINLHFLGSNPEAQAIGDQLLDEKTNYLLGNDPQNFHTNIPHYARARFEQVYPGIDVVYYGDGGRLKYDIVVAPGTNPDVIKIRFDGVEKTKLDRDGTLLLNMPGGRIVQPKPLIYQTFNDQRRYVNGSYVIQGRNQIGFRLGAYDRNQPLVIDPVLIFSTYLGGAGSEEGAGVATDFAGNAYIVGTTSSLNFPITPGVVQSVNGVGKDVFVTKLNPNGSGVVYSTYIGGSLDDFGYAITLDNTGDAYITGTTSSANYPTTTGAVQSLRRGTTDAFVTRLSANGAALVYSTYLGGDANEEGFGIALDVNRNAHVTGVTSSNNFSVTTGAMQANLAGPTDAFVTKLNSSGSVIVFSTYVGGSGAESGFGIALQRSDDSAVITGVTDSMNFPTTTGAFRTVSAGSSDAFVVKLNSNGSAATYATFLGGSGIDAGLAVAVDNTGNVYVNGLTDSSDFPTTLGSLQQANAGGESDAFVTKLNASGAALIYSTYMGGSGLDTSTGIALDFSEKATLTGTTASTDFPVTGDAIQPIFAGVKDAFISRLNRNGTSQIYSSFIGGAQSEESLGVSIDIGANTYVTGTTSSSNFPTTNGAFLTTAKGGNDGFVVKVGPGAESPIQLLLDTSGPAVDQVSGLESVALLRDPLPVISPSLLSIPTDRNTRLIIFLANLQLLTGETASSVTVNLLDGNNQSHDVTAEDVRQVPNFPFTQVTFRLPDNLSAGSYSIKVKAHGMFSNVGTIRIRN